MSNKENKDDMLDQMTDDKVEDQKSEKPKFKAGVGFDVGTANLVVCRQTVDGNFVNKFHRNMLYEMNVTEEATDLLERSSYSFTKIGNKYFVVGEDALRLCNIVNGEIIRPMESGLLSPALKGSSELLFYIIKAVIGTPIVPKEALRFSCPANCIDTNTDNLFHQMILKNFFEGLNYSAKSLNEAMAICYDCNPKVKTDDKEEDLSGVCISTGAGQWNISMSYKGLSLVEFSCTKSGDYLDSQVSMVTGIPKSKVVLIKEKQLNLDKVDMNDRVQAALSIYYDEMISRMLHLITKKFIDINSTISGAVEIVVSGGTSMVPGFINRFEKVLSQTEMPFKVWRVRQSKTPFYSTAQGACVRAIADQQKQDKK